MSAARAGLAGLPGALLCATVLLAPPAAADDEARRWLHGMGEALATRNYEGELLHQAHGSYEMLRILHRVRDGRVSERLVSQNGNGREMVRHDAEVQCYLPDERKVVVESYVDHGPLLGTLPTFDDRLEENYHVTLGERVLALRGSPARIIVVSPKDGYRFGYRVWVDERSKMPLRTDLCDAHGELLEQVQFVRLQMDPPLPDAAFRPAVDATGYTLVRAAHQRPRETADGPAWLLHALPPGFRMRAAGEDVLPGGDRAQVTHFVLSDGLASVSVFIEAGPEQARSTLPEEGRLGAAYAYTRFVAGHKITAVGEVPRETVQYIAAGVAPSGPRGPAGRAPELAQSPPRHP
jgi:sigma-E factor negative regulatory protein RseB